MKVEIDSVEIQIDEEDLAVFLESSWRVARFSGGIRYVQKRGKYQPDSLLHRKLAGAKEGEIVDHANGDTLDNRKQNLRVCTRAENTRNRRKQANSKQPYKGVALCTDRKRNKPWRAFIGKECKTLGWYATAEEAAKAYDAASIKRFGEFARPNFKD